eukprot:COSAG02_NODE_1258_length_13569_cov_5.275650_1_plen_193_part_10
MPEPEPEPEPALWVPQGGHQQLQHEWCCSLQASRAELEPAFEACIRHLASGELDLLESIELTGGGTPYYGDWAGVSLGDAQVCVGNDDGYVYGEYGGLLHEQTLMDFFGSKGKQKVEFLAKAVVGGLESAGVPKDEWLRKLTNMHKDGDLDSFLETAIAQAQAVVQQDTAKMRNTSSQSTSYDYGDYNGVSLE